MKWLSIAIAVLLSWPAYAATMNLELVIAFDGVKTVHGCFGGGGPYPGDGNCGRFQSIPLGSSFAGEISVKGIFETDDGVNYTYLHSDGASFGGRATCSFGTVNCSIVYFTGDPNSFSASSVFLSGASSGYNFDEARFGFDLLAGTGWYEWTDDFGDWFGQGRFEFTNAKMQGLPPPPVPLPAASLLLLSAIAGIGLARRLRQT